MESNLGDSRETIFEVSSLVLLRWVISSSSSYPLASLSASCSSSSSSASSMITYPLYLGLIFLPFISFFDFVLKLFFLTSMTSEATDEDSSSSSSSRLLSMDFLLMPVFLGFLPCFLSAFSAKHEEQIQVPLGFTLILGSWQSMWYPLSQASQKRMDSTSPDPSHLQQSLQYMHCQGDSRHFLANSVE